MFASVVEAPPGPGMGGGDQFGGGGDEPGGGDGTIPVGDDGE